MLTAERNRLGTLRIASVCADIEAHTEWLAPRLKEVDKHLNKMLRVSAVWREKEALYRSVPGKGPLSASTATFASPRGSGRRGAPGVAYGAGLGVPS